MLHFDFLVNKILYFVNSSLKYFYFTYRFIQLFIGIINDVITSWVSFSSRNARLKSLVLIEAGYYDKMVQWFSQGRFLHAFCCGNREMLQKLYVFFYVSQPLSFLIMSLPCIITDVFNSDSSKQLLVLSLLDFGLLSIPACIFFFFFVSRFPPWVIFLIARSALLPSRCKVLFCSEAASFLVAAISLVYRGKLAVKCRVLILDILVTLLILYR